jgi:hypothetical protein
MPVVAEVMVATSMPLEPAWVDRTAVAAAVAVGDSMDALVPVAEDSQQYCPAGSVAERVAVAT